MVVLPYRSKEQLGTTADSSACEMADAVSVTRDHNEDSSAKSKWHHAFEVVASARVQIKGMQASRKFVQTVQSVAAETSVRLRAEATRSPIVADRKVTRSAGFQHAKDWWETEGGSLGFPGIPLHGGHMDTRLQKKGVELAWEDWTDFDGSDLAPDPTPSEEDGAVKTQAPLGASKRRRKPVGDGSKSGSGFKQGWKGKKNGFYPLSRLMLTEPAQRVKLDPVRRTSVLHKASQAKGARCRRQQLQAAAAVQNSVYKQQLYKLRFTSNA
jgi:hypothetical protein